MIVTTRIRLAAVTAGLTLALSPSAQAAEVSRAGGELIYAAAPGETNRLSVADFGNGELVFGDTTAALTAGEGCRPAQPEGHGATCSAAGIDQVRINVADGDDAVYGYYTTAPLIVDAGAGNDTVVAGQGTNTIFGGEGNDALTTTASGIPQSSTFDGGPGDDVITALEGRDTTRGNPHGGVFFTGVRDQITCGDGNDVAKVDRLDTLAPGCEDVTTFVDFATVLLRGTPGKDVIRAPRVAYRNYSIEAGAGNDRIDAVNGARDVVDCGRGHDAVVADRTDRVARNCERVTRRRR
jgi:Ca2+-binding RTX toxin-like protein